MKIKAIYTSSTFNEALEAVKERVIVLYHDKGVGKAKNALRNHFENKADTINSDGYKYISRYDKDTYIVEEYRNADGMLVINEWIIIPDRLTDTTKSSMIRKDM